MEEKWQVIEAFPRYSVSNYGYTRRDATGRIMAYSRNQSGLVCVGLMKGSIQHHVSVPLMVARAFIPRTLSAFDTPINKDGNRWNNSVENLVWRPRWFAVLYNKQFTEPYDYPIPFPIRECRTQEVFANSFVCSITFGLLERDLVLSILNNTYTAITYQKFEVVDY